MTVWYSAEKNPHTDRPSQVYWVVDFEPDVLGIAVKIVLDGVDKRGCGEIEVVNFLFAGNVVCRCVFAHA